MPRAPRGHPPEVLRSMRVLLAMWDELREKPGPYCFEMRGASMWPAAPHGSLLEVVPCPAAALAPGDLVTFRRAGTLVTHRVVAVGADQHVHAWGDSLLRPDRPIPPGDVFGRAAVVRRGPVLSRWAPYVAARWALASAARRATEGPANAASRPTSEGPANAESRPTSKPRGHAR